MSAEIDQTTNRVKAFYEHNPYPGLGDQLLPKGARRLSPYFEEKGRVLYPGCGTGHGMVSMALLRPDLEVYGMDLSQPSLDIARLLAEKHGAVVEVKQGDYMKPLPWPCKFQYMILEGTLHHAADPKIALINLVSHLEHEGLIFINLYGKKYHRRRFEIVEMLDLMQGQANLQQRFALFKALQGEGLNRRGARYPYLDISPRLVLRWLRRTIRRFKSRDVNSVPWTAEFKELDQLWIDQYNHPHEKTYDIWEAKELFESANLEVIKMFSLGLVAMEDLPEMWRPLLGELDTWSQFRLMELYYPNTGSISALARKKP